MSLPHTQTRLTCGTRQDGAALLILLVIVIIATTGVLLNSLNRVTVTAERDKKTAEALAQAKEALIYFSTIKATRPGDLPIPDVLEPSESPPNYDGTTDGITNGCPGTGAAKRCLGRLPWRDLGMSLDTSTENDVPGVMPWYAVSANLANPLLLDVLNSETANLGLALPQPWLTVRDARGNVISSRVVAVVILPGAPVGSQARPEPPNLAGVNQYLDTVIVPVGCAAPCVPGTYSNSDLDNDFIMGEDFSRTADLDDNFNDRLIYITIDELMTAVEKRVGNELKTILAAYYSVQGYYPWADFMVPQGGDSDANVGLNRGDLPLGGVPNDSAWFNRLPGWFKDNAWFDMIYYSVGRNYTQTPGSCTSCIDDTLSVDGVSGYHVVFFMPGTATGTTVRPSAVLSDYLEDPENNDNNDDLYVTPTSQARDRDRLFRLP